MNYYKNINQLNYLPSDRLIKLLKIDLKNIKSNNASQILTNIELEDVICEMEMIIHILNMRNCGVIHNVAK